MKVGRNIADDLKTYLNIGYKTLTVKAGKNVFFLRIKMSIQF